MKAWFYFILLSKVKRPNVSFYLVIFYLVILKQKSFDYKDDELRN